MPEKKERPPYYPMVYIILALKRVSMVHVSHIGVQESDKTWVPLCQSNREKPSRCEYQYRTTLDRIECEKCRLIATSAAKLNPAIVNTPPCRKGNHNDRPAEH